MKMGRGAFLALGITLGVVSGGGAMVVPAAAQTVTDPTVMRSCLCEQQAVQALQDTVAARSQALDAARRNEASLNNQVATRRAQINVYDQNEIDAFKRLLVQRDAAAAATYPAAQSYDAAATSYNQAVDAYNARCAGRDYDQNVLRQVTATLACPRLQPPPQ